MVIKSRSKEIDLRNPDTYVTCMICGGVMENLTQHINRIHNICGAEYRRIYGGNLRSKSASGRHAKTMKKFLSVPENIEHWRRVQERQFARFTPDERKDKWGKGGERHGMWGRKHSKESLEKNSRSNKIAHKLVLERKRREGVLEEFMESRVNRGEKNGMYGTTPPKGSGRCHYVQYTSTMSGKSFWLQGSYEVRFAKLLDKLRCSWEKTKDMFPYVYKGGNRTYNPDFKVVKKRGIFYYETKGYIDDIAEVKFSVMRELKLNFTVVDKKRLERYERLTGIR